tara:strand:+ start:1945 stop:2436 length:492 start_codon:yes stop_codon:yes gene_type:complete
LDEKIMIVDDQLINIMALKIILKIQGVNEVVSQLDLGNIDQNSSDSEEINQVEMPYNIIDNSNQRIDGVVSGKEAVELTEKLWVEHRRFYRIIFMDCNMPEMDGYETTRTIREFVAQKQRDVKDMIVDDNNEDQVLIKAKLQEAVNNEPLIVAVTGHIGRVYE